MKPMSGQRWTCVLTSVAVWLVIVESVTFGQDVAAPLPARSADLPRAAPGDAGFDASLLSQLEEIVAQGVADKKMPGCVVAIGRHGKVAWLEAYGNRQVRPATRPMTVNTVFDMASITKPVATGTSVMVLVEQGKLRIHERVQESFPQFASNGKHDVTILQLLTHHGGLIPDNAIADYDHGNEEAWRRILQLSTYRPQARSSSTRTSGLSCWPNWCATRVEWTFMRFLSSMCSSR